MESLEAERSKQKNKLLKSLAQRKAKDSKDPINCNPATLKKMEDKTRKQVQLLDLNFNQQEAAAFSRPQGDVLLGTLISSCLFRILFRVPHFLFLPHCSLQSSYVLYCCGRN